MFSSSKGLAGMLLSLDEAARCGGVKGGIKRGPRPVVRCRGSSRMIAGENGGGICTDLLS